jgi:hypothetical protein
MFSKNTLIVDFGPDQRPGVLLMTQEDCRSFYKALDFAETVHGMDGPNLQPVLNRWLGDGAVRFWHIYDAVRGLAVAEDKTLPELVRVFAAALVCSKPLPGSHGSGGDVKRDDGGTKARLKPDRPRRPPSGGAVNPLADMLSVGGAS